MSGPAEAGPHVSGLERFSLRGRRALVVGASRGIGLAIAHHLAAAGARTVLAARSADVLGARVNELRAAGLDVEALVMDATDAVAVRVAAANGPIPDVLAVVVGANRRRPLVAFEEDEIEALLSTNLRSALHVARHVGGRMVARATGGKVIFIASLAARVGLPNMSVYAATKGALASLTTSLAAEWAPAGIQVNAIMPGFIVTDLNRHVWADPAMRAWLAAVQANPDLGTPDDVAPLAVYLAAPASDYMTGQLIAIDGGFSTTRMWPFEGDA